MRLLSKQNDYYDSVFKQYSSEKKNVFVRNTEDIVKKLKLDTINLPKLKNNQFSYDFKFGLIGFCGSFYPYVKVYQYNYFGYVINVNFCYTIDQIEKSVHGYKEWELKYTKGYFYGNKSFHSIVKEWLGNGTINKFMSNFDIYKNNDLIKIFKEHNTAYFQVDLEWEKYQEYIVTVYPILKDFQFYKVYDVFGASQAIENYLCNVLVEPDNPYIAPVPDSIKAQSKGFDKFSFRKDKSKKK
jgi:hypothetical protein